MLRSTKLLAWYRAIPLLVLLVMGLISFAFSFSPAAFVSPLYPLEYREDIERASAAYKVDPMLVAAVIDTESNWDIAAVSHRGAQGLMQLMPDTARDMVELGLVDGDLYRPDNLIDPATNITFGCAYLAYLIDYFDGSTDHAIAAYNAGLSHVEDWAQAGTVLHNAITFPETQAYLMRVSTAWARYRELYGSTFTG